MDRAVESACAGLGAGERSVIYLAAELKPALVLIDEDRARRVAKTLQLPIAGSIAVLERGTKVVQWHSKNAFSVAGNLLLTEATLTEERGERTRTSTDARICRVAEGVSPPFSDFKARVPLAHNQHWAWCVIKNALR